MTGEISVRILGTAVQLFDRQKRLLGLLNALGGTVGNLDFQKLLFLYCEEHPNEAPYEFVPYNFGAFSFSSYADHRRLVERGLLDDDDRGWRLTEMGSRVVGQLKIDLKPIAGFARTHRELRGDELVAETYRRFPYYATRSEIADHVLAGDDKALRRIAKAIPATSGPGLSTIGYEGRAGGLPQRIDPDRRDAAVRRATQRHQQEVRLLEGHAHPGLRGRWHQVRTHS